MKNSRRPLLFRSATLAILAFWVLRLADAASPPATVLAPPPGVVIDQTPLPDTEFIGSPSLSILPDGTYVASHDFFGKKGDALGSTRIFASKDRGATWQQLAELPHQIWSSLFVQGDALYLLGITKEYGDVVIRCSTDGGHTWTTPADARSGVLFTGQFHCAPVPVVVHQGRLWCAVEEVVNSLLWPRHFAALVISAPADADLLNAANWTRTNGVPFDGAWIPGKRPGWLEGNVVITPEGGLVDLLRVNAEIDDQAPFALPGGAAGIPRYEVAARTDLSPDGKMLTFDAAKGFFRLPGSQSKFTIRYDPVSKRYWSLVDKITLPTEDRDFKLSPVSQRNVVMLISSADLKNWQEHSKILRWRDGGSIGRKDRFGFQYLDWQFDGDDLVAVSRTAWGAQNFHNANFLTFHRIKNFRKLTPADSPPDLISQTPDLPPSETGSEAP